MNPFNLTGWEAMLTTAIVCGTVIACMVIGGRVTVETTKLICAASQEFANAVTDAIVAVFNGKVK